MVLVMTKQPLVSEALPGVGILTIESAAFPAGGRMPARYTADGEGISPPLKWSGVPAEAKGLVLLVEDPDAPRPEPFLHWMAYHIDPASLGLPEDVPGPGHPGIPARMHQGPNTQGAYRYTPPAPPPGSGTHHYHFELFAVDSKLHLPDEATREELVRAMAGHVIASGELVGCYAR